jgi:hypothetical protein
MNTMTKTRALLFVLAATSHALATPNFPDAIASHLSASGPPSCQVCHNGRTGTGTVTRAFGVSMRERGLTPFDTNSLTAALDRMTKDAVDSNGDGVLDTEALKKGEDPNGSTGTGAQPIGDLTPQPGYGCGAQIAPTEGLSWTLLTALGFALARKRRAVVST